MKLRHREKREYESLLMRTVKPGENIASPSLRLEELLIASGRWEPVLPDKPRLVITYTDPPEPEETNPEIDLAVSKISDEFSPETPAHIESEPKTKRGKHPRKME